MLPAWVSEPPAAERFGDHQGEDQRAARSHDRRARDHGRPGGRGPRREFDRGGGKGKPGDRPQRPEGRPNRGQNRTRFGRPGEQRAAKHRQHERPRPVEKPLPAIAVRFLPRATAFDSVVEQIKSGAVAYSLFALARLFLEKATRHDVKLTPPEGTPLFQVGEHGPISLDRQFLERNAFRFALNDFFRVEVTETEPLKGNFTNVARERFSGTLLGPTNHHDYQRRLRHLYEQRFSRRMSFPDFQRQIQIVTDPAEIEKWKEDARKVTTYSTLHGEPVQTFGSVTEAERYFEKHHLPGLVRAVAEVTLDGPASRQLSDRILARVIENAWNHEIRSPSPIMQELGARFREVGLHIFRHRRGMLFVSPIYPRAFTSEQTAVSSQVRTIVEAIAAQPRIGRKELADKLIGGQKSAEPAPAAEEIERARLALASDLLWLISSGHVIEFNDGSLDLPRAKTKPKENVEPGPTEAESKPESAGETSAPPARELEVRADANPATMAPEKEDYLEAAAPAPEGRLVEENSAEIRGLDPINGGRTDEPPLPDSDAEIGGS